MPIKTGARPSTRSPRSAHGSTESGTTASWSEYARGVPNSDPDAPSAATHGPGIDAFEAVSTCFVTCIATWFGLNFVTQVGFDAVGIPRPMNLFPWGIIAISIPLGLSISTVLLWIRSKRPPAVDSRALELPTDDTGSPSPERLGATPPTATTANPGQDPPGLSGLVLRTHYKKLRESELGQHLMSAMETSGHNDGSPSSRDRAAGVYFDFFSVMGAGGEVVAPDEFADATVDSPYPNLFNVAAYNAMSQYDDDELLELYRGDPVRVTDLGAYVDAFFPTFVSELPRTATGVRDIQVYKARMFVVVTGMGIYLDEKGR